MKRVFKRILSAVLVICMSVSVLAGTVVGVSAEDAITLVIDGQTKRLNKAIEIDENGVVFVPLEETFAYLGVDMVEKQEGIYKGFGNNGEIVIDLSKDTAEVDWVDLELPAAPYVSGGTVMVPAYLIEDAVKTEPAVYDTERGVLSVTSPDPDDEYYGGADIGAIMETLPAGEIIVNQDDLYNKGWSSGNVTVTKNVSVNVDGVQTTALQLRTNSIAYGETPDIGAMTYKMSMSGLKSFTKGDVGVIHFKARATAVNQPGDAASLRVMYERSTDWSKLGIKDYDVEYNEWKDYYLPLDARMLGWNPSGEWPADKSSIGICVGALPQTVQLANFEVIYYGSSVAIEQLQPDTGSYHGIEEDALWRKEAWRRIEKYRKDDVLVRVVDEEGNPVEGVEVQVNQTESEFAFGTELCHDELVSYDPNSTKGKSIQKAIKSFNSLVCGLEMKPYKQILDDGTKGVEMVNNALGRNMRLRGHTIMWDAKDLIGFLSETGDHADLSYEELYRRVMDFVVPNAYLFKGKTFQWDVLNEPTSSNHVRKTFNTTRLYTDITKLVHQIDPEAKLIVNEAHMMGKNKGDKDVLPTFLNIIKQMQSEGAHIDGLGIQAHVNNYFYPQGLYRQLDECAQLVDEVAITEFDFVHEDQTNAAQYVGDLLTAAFSHPKCRTFTIWSMCTYSKDKNIGVFFDYNWNEKPAKAVWDDLVFNQFKTNMNLVSDSDGCADFRGFHGDYTITVNYDGKTKKFDFGLLKDGNNTIEITVGDRISAEVSSGKSIIIPEETEFSSLSEAADDYRQNVGEIPFTSIVLEQNLRGVLASGGPMLNGGNIASSADYNAGKVWGSKSGVSAVAYDDPSGQGILYKNAVHGTFDLSHVSSGTAVDEGNMEVSAIIGTGNSRTAGFSLGIGYTSSDLTIPFGYIKTSATGYFVETAGGKKIKLKDNTDYDVRVTLVKTDFPQVYDVKYTVEENCKDVICEITEKQTWVNSLEALSGIAFVATTNGAEGRSVLALKQARMKFFACDAPVTYQDADGTSEMLYDSLRHYDTSEIVSLTDARYLSGKNWGTDNLSTVKDYFAYLNHSDHLYSIRTAPAGEQVVKKNIGAVKAGDDVEIDFDFYIDQPREWYNSGGYVDVRLESADGSIKRSLVKHEYLRNDYGRRVCFFGDKNGTYQDTQKVEYTDSITGKGTYNRNNLHINVQMTQNAKGNYDATMTFTNELGTQKSWTIADYVTGDEFQKLNTFVFAGQTLTAGLKYDNGVAGIKDIIVKKTSDLIKNGDAIVLSPGDTVGIKFHNPLERPFDTQLVLVRYADNKFSSMKTLDFDGRKDAEGYLSIRVDKEKQEENSFMVMLLDGNGCLKPLKKAEMVIIN